MAMKKNGFGRRRFLIGAGGVTFGLPFLNYFGSFAKAQGMGPKRFILMFHHQGTLANHWVNPGGSPTEFSLGHIAQPLERYRSQIIVPRNVDNKVVRTMHGNGHNKAARSVITAQVWQGDHAAGPSIDQYLGQKMRGSYRFSNINLAVGKLEAEQRCQYAGPGDLVEGENHPQEALSRIFASANGEQPVDNSGAVKKLYARNKSVLDAVSESFKELQGRVGAEDKQRLEQHAQKVRELETRILADLDPNAMPTTMVGCGRPSISLPGGFSSSSDNAEYDATDAQLDILTFGLQCGLAPVGSLVFANAQDPFSRLPGRWHDNVHGGDNNTTRQGFRWYTDQFVKLMDRLNNLDDPLGGKMIDHTAVLWISEHGNGASHSSYDMPVVLAGNLGPGVTKGRAYSTNGASHNQVFVSLLNAFGYNENEFGAYVGGAEKGGLPGL